MNLNPIQAQKYRRTIVNSWETTTCAIRAASKCYFKATACQATGLSGADIENYLKMKKMISEGAKMFLYKTFSFVKKSFK